MSASRLIVGRARILGDDVNTDYIISSARKRESIDARVLKQFLLEGVDPAFAASVQPSDVLVAGRNFGCGSAMEVAVTVILAAGIPAVLASSFSRTFFRNAINNGLLPVVAETGLIREGDVLEIALGGAGTTLRSRTANADVSTAGLSDIALRILEVGGLVPYVRRHGSLRPRPVSTGP